ncbi:MAG TPA: serine hydrolase domain-containing protein [Chitinophagaceae bacterium]|nr:serine hydrolase domain-containing protein [Chitinophagaceae bacterium]
MKYIITCQFLLLSIFSLSQPLVEVKPESAGMSSERLKRIDALLQEYIDKQYIAGGTAIIIKDGKIVYHKAIGYDERAGKAPLKRDAIFRIASQTKAITSVAVMMLYEEGKLMLDDPLGKYIPEYTNQVVLDKFNAVDTTYTTVKANRQVTIRDLLTHTSGIGYAQIGSPESNAIYYKYGVVGGIGVGRIYLADKMKILGGLPLLHQPGEKWTYGLNTDLLGYLVEVVSGMDLATFLKKKIFDPLGMKDTYFYLPAAKHSRLVSLYTEDSLKHAIKAAESFNINGEVLADYPLTEGTYYSGGGGLSSTALDYGIFLQMLLNKGRYNGKRILSPASVRMMTSEQYRMPWGDNVMGLGFGVYTEKSAARKPPSAGSYEWGGMFSSSYWADPEEKIAGQLFLNQFPNSHGEIHDKFKVLVYAAINE